MALDRLSQVTSSGISSTVNFRATGITVSGIVTANSFVGDGSGLTGVVGSGSGVVIKDDNATVGTASTINFGSNLSVSAISSGIVTVTGTDTNTTYTQASVADGSNVNLRLSGSDSTTDDILLTAGSNISFSGVGAGGFTINSSAGGGGSSQFVTTSAGIHTLSNVGIGTTNPISALTVTGNTLVTGVVTATSFSGSGSGLTNIPAGQLTGTLPAIDGSSLTGIVGSGSGIIVKDSGSTVGTAGTIDFGDNLTVSAISAGIVTVTGSAGGGSSQFVTTSTGIHTLSNVGIGTTNPTKKLTVSGDALINGLTVGVGTGTITGNTVLGLNAFFSNTTGIDNTAVGAGVLYLNLTGSDNTAIGRGSQYSNNGNYNTSTGSLALYGLVSGQYNVAIGYESARESYIATGNVAIGGLALRTNYTGLNNVAIGYYAGYGVTTSNNVIIGPAPSGAVPNVTYQPPIPNGDTQLVIGAGNTAWIHGNSSYNIGIGTTNPTSKLTVSGDIKVTGVVTATTFVGALTGTASNVTTNANLTGDVTSTGNATSIAAGVIVDADINASAAISLSKLSTSGTLTATTFVGALTGNASSATIATYTSEWILGANGSADYTFTGSGLIGAENDPVLYLVRGQQYKFTNTMGAHPFRIQSTVNGSTGTQYNDGITNNDVSNGTLTWNVQFDAPNILYYQCTAHGSMGGKIYIIDAGVGPDISINTTGIITATSIVVSAGSTSAPSISPSGDPNTGVFFPSDDTISASTGGTQRITIDSSGNINIDGGTVFVDATNNRFGVGTTTPTERLQVDGNILAGASGQIMTISGAAQYGSRTSNSVLFLVNNSEVTRIDSSGKLLVGTTSSRIVEDWPGNGPQGLIQIEATNSDAIMSIISAGTADAQRCGTLSLGRHRNATVGAATPTIVQSGDALGAICFAGGDGTDMRTKGASIRCEVDGTPGADDMPGRLIFSTTANDASTPTERMRISSTGELMFKGAGTTPGTDKAVSFSGSAPVNSLVIDSSGRLGIGNSSPAQRLHVSGSNAGGFQVTNADNSDAISLFVRGGNAINSTTDNAVLHVGQRSDVSIITTGRVGIGTQSPGSILDINGPITLRSSGTVRGYIGDVDSDTNIQVRSEAQTVFKIGNNEAARIDTSRRLLVGTISGSGDALLGIQGRISDTARGGILQLRRGQAASALSAGDDIGAIRFSDNTSGNTGFAEILCASDGASGSGDYPGRLVFSTTADGAPSPTPRMTITNGGTIFFGKTTNDFTTEGVQIRQGDATTGFVTAGGTVITFSRTTNDGTIVSLRQDGIEEGSISVSGTTVSYNGAHLSRWSQLLAGAERIEILRGTVLSNLDEMCEWTDEDNEQLNRMKVSDVEGDKNVSGVFQCWDDDDDTYTNDFYCAMTGDFIIRIGAGVTVERGDLLMSAGDGTAKPQDDDIIRSKTIAKVTSTHITCTYEDGSYCMPCVLMAC